MDCVSNDSPFMGEHVDTKLNMAGSLLMMVIVSVILSKVMQGWKILDEAKIEHATFPQH